MSITSKLPPHDAIAEQGKVLALGGRYDEALLHYRLAMRKATEARAPEVTIRHYVDCCIDSLEHRGDYDAVIGYADQVIAAYGKREPTHPLHWRDLATAHERRAAALLKAGRWQEAATSCQAAEQAAMHCGQTAELAKRLLPWCNPRLTVPVERIVSEQNRCQSFVVRDDTVDRKRARPVPTTALNAGPSF